MLLLRRERVFARAAPDEDCGGSVLSVASLTRGSGESGPRFAGLSGDLRTALDARTRTSHPQTGGPPA
jgi:cytochrome c biogenesis protein